MKKFFRAAVLLLSVGMIAHLGVAQTTVKINEAYSRGVAGNLDWVEIYNAATTSIDISGFKIYDGGGKWGGKAKKLFPAGTVLPAQGFTVVIVDTASYAGDLSGFGLSSTADTVWIENLSGVVIDSVALPALGVDTSYARVPDGGRGFVKNAPVSRGFSNVVTKINEAYSRGVAGNLDWVEIYNTASTSVDISGFKIYDGGGKWGGKAKKVFPAGTVLASKGFSVVVVDTASFSGDLSGFGLSSTADTVWVENLAGVVIDSVAIPALGVDSSYARVPDGSGAFKRITPATKGKTNGGATSVKQLSTVAQSFSLEQNFPNPFNPSTTIRYQLPAAARVSLKIFDLVGREIATLVNGHQEAGAYVATFNASALSSGMYLYQLKAGIYSEIKKMMLLK